MSKHWSPFLYFDHTVANHLHFIKLKIKLINTICVNFILENSQVYYFSFYCILELDRTFYKSRYLKNY